MTHELADRLWPRVDKSGGPEACWPFMGARSDTGYGSIVGKVRGSTHRIAYMDTHGPIPEGMRVCHSCDNPPCCNPAHLWLGTVGDNSRDMVAKGRSSHLRNERSGKAKLTDAQVAEIRERWSTGETLKSIAPEFDVSDSHLSRVVRGVRRPPEGGHQLPARPLVVPAAKPPAPARRWSEAERVERVLTRDLRREALERRRDECVRLYLGGLTLIQTGQRLGIHHTAVLRALRVRGVPTRKPHDYDAPFDHDLVRQWHADGIRAAEMCRRLSIGPRRLYQAFDLLDLPRFDPGAPRLPIRSDAS